MYTFIRHGSKLLLFFFLAVAVQAEAKDLYVDMNDGSCSDSYTRAENDANNPWCTLGKAAWGQTAYLAPASYPSINSTTNAAQAGDTVYVNAGTYVRTGTSVDYNGNPVYNPVNEGSAGNYITFEAVGTVILQDTSTPNVVTTGQPIIGTQNRDYVVWDGFYIDEHDLNTGRDTGPVGAWGSSFVTFKNLTIIGEEELWDDNHDGIRLENSFDITIYNNNISDFRLYPGNEGSQNTAGIATYNTDRVSIYNNTITDCGSGMYIKQGNEGPYYIYKNRIYADIHGILIQQLTSGEVYQNIVTGGTNSIKIQSYASAYGPDDLDVANNVFYGSSSRGYHVSSVQYSENIRFYNNIFSSTSGIAIHAATSSNATLSAAVDFEHNHYYNNSTHAQTSSGTYSLSTWKSTVGQDTVTGNGRAGEESNPGFTNAGADDYTLTGGANARDGGVDILDLDGDLSTTDSVHRGAYVTGSETIGTGAGEEPDPVNGVCGSNDGDTLDSLTSGDADNCSIGDVSSFSGTGPWTWTCDGTDGGSDDSCSATLYAIPASHASGNFSWSN